MKRFLALAVTVVMVLGIFTGCYNNYRLKEFDIEVGDKITFGKYQDEEIEWEVMSRHFLPEEGKVRVQLQSKYVLDCQPFDEDGESSWEDCSLREWLNNDFFNSAFSKKEQKQIVDTKYFNYMGDERFLTDKVYIVSHLWYYWRPDEAMCKPTDYAEEQGVDMDDGYCRYWGRDVLEAIAANVEVTGGGLVKFPVAFTYSGYVGSAGTASDPGRSFTAENIGVRPIINVEYKAPYEMKDLECGDIVTFGTYDEEPIEWIVADSGKKGVILFSRYGLEDRRLDKKDLDEFEDSELYEWLNGDFKEEAFSKKELKHLVGSDSDGAVTLFDRDEMKEYGKEMRYELFTGYTESYYDDNGIDDSNVLDHYWLKDIDEDSDPPYWVFDIRSFGFRTDPDKEFSVRPVIKITF